MMLLLVILMGFAWAIGGEHGFGKWRRGVLISLVSVLMGIVLGISWWALFMLGCMFYLYQALFYDICIQLVWGTGRSWIEKVLGWLGLLGNGMICGLFPMVINFSQGKFISGTVALVLSGIGFAFICWLSNGLKWGWNGCYGIKVSTGEIKVWCPKDTWWWACFIYGIILGVASWLV